MDFQILDADYKLVHEVEPVIRLFGRSDDGRSVCCLVPGFEPYFYAKPKVLPAGKSENICEDLTEKYPQIKRIEPVERFEPIGYQTQKKPMLRIVVYSPKNVPEIRDDILREPFIDEIYESDILFRNRFLIDRNISGMSWVSAEEDGSVPPEKSEEIRKLLPSKCDVTICTENVTPLEKISNAPLRYMAFDIECLPQNSRMPSPEWAPVILISFAFRPACNGRDTLVLAAKPAPDLNVDPASLPEDVTIPGDDVLWLGDEETLLRKFFAVINEFDPDIISGYNINEFDLPYIIDRIEALRKNGIRIPLDFSRDGSLIHIRKFAMSSKVEVLGRVVADSLPLIRRNYSLKQYTLKNVSKELLNREKLDVPYTAMEEYWNDDGAKLFRFIDYSRRDSELAIELLLDLKLLDKFIALAQITNSVFQEVIGSGQTAMVEQVMIREYKKRDRVMAVKPGGEDFDERGADDDSLKGGAVLDPVKGLHENVIILDYKSLYPTIMMAHNLCYTTVVEDGADLKALGLTEDDINVTPAGGRFVKASVCKGVVPSILEDLLDRRVQTKKKMKAATEEHEIFALDATQMALKILLNSYYGYSGYARARLYSLNLANSVTGIGRENIIRTRRIITEDIGLVFIYDGKALLEPELRDMNVDPFSKDVLLIRPQVVYGDTDSVFVHCTADGGGEFPDGVLTLEKTALAGARLAAIVTESLPKPMELEFEAIARRVVLIAKKRYAQWLFEPSGDGWKDKIKVKGMETVRRDWCELTRFTLDRILKLVLIEGNIEAAVRLVKDTITALRTLDLAQNPEFLDKLILTKSYSKSPDSYKSKQPHIQVVDKIRARTGVDTPIGTRVPFVIVAGKGLFADRAEDPDYVIEHNLPIDVDYYISKQLLPPVERIFEGFGVDASSLGRYQQRGLFDFGAPAGPLSVSSSNPSSGSSSVSPSVSLSDSSDSSSGPEETVDTGVSGTFSRPVREESADPAADAGNEPKKEKTKPVLDLSAAFGTRKRPKIVKNDQEEGNDVSGISEEAPDSVTDNAADKTTESSPDSAADKTTESSSDSAADKTTERSSDSAADKMTESSSDNAADKMTESSSDSAADKMTDSAPADAAENKTGDAPDIVPTAEDTTDGVKSGSGTSGSGNPENSDKKEKKGQASLFDF